MGNLFARSTPEWNILNALQEATPQQSSQNASSTQSPKTPKSAAASSPKTSNHQGSSSPNASNSPRRSTSSLTLPHFAKSSVPIHDMTEQDVCKWLQAIGLQMLVEKARFLRITGMHLMQRNPKSKRVVTMLRTLTEPQRLTFEREVTNLMAPNPIKPLPVLRNITSKEESFVTEKLTLRYLKAAVTKQKAHLLKEMQVLSQADKLKNTLLKLDKSDLNSIDRRGWRIKLVITELSHNPLPKKQRDFRSHASTVLNWISLAPTFGMFHSALIVGPFYLHWSDSELVIPRSDNFMSAAAYFASDICTVDMSAEDGLDRIATLVCYWNRRKKYHNIQANCHHFVEDMFSAFGVDLNEYIKNSAIADYVNRLKTKGSCDLRFKLSDDLLDKVGEWLREKKWIQDDKYIIFETHKQLDEFYRKIEETDRDYFLYGRGVQDRALLKSFDRGFWLRYFHVDARAEIGNATGLQQERQRYEPHQCPFGNPRDSSFRMLEELKPFTQHNNYVQ